MAKKPTTNISKPKPSATQTPIQDDNDTGTDLIVLQTLSKSWKDYSKNARRNTPQSLDWFRNIVTKNYKDVRTARMFRDRNLWKTYDKIIPGRLYFFEYKAETVDFWDRYPLAFIFDKWEKNGVMYMIGLNMHWLSPVMRMAAFTALLKFRTEKRYRRKTKIAVEWGILKSLAESKYFAHCIRMYRAERMQSVAVEIPAQSWELALYLPLQRFVGGDKAEAWQLKK